MSRSDDDLMRQALAQAASAAQRGEVPIGAVLYEPASGEILSADGNRTIELNDPTAHAEILAIREACRLLDNYRLPACELFVTLEPCAMCAGAISFARISRLIYGASDPKGGSIVHGPRFFEQPTCHHRPEIRTGIQAEEASQLLKGFFAKRR